MRSLKKSSSTILIWLYVWRHIFLPLIQGKGIYILQNLDLKITRFLYMYKFSYLDGKIYNKKNINNEKQIYYV